MTNNTCKTCGSIGFELSQTTMTSNDCIMCRPIHEAFIAGFKRSFSLPMSPDGNKEDQLNMMAEEAFKNWMSEKRMDKKSNATISIRGDEDETL